MEDLQLGNKRKALKLLHRHMSQDKTYLSRFKNEVQLTQTLEHENIVRVYDLGETEKHEYYFTMEYIEGRSLGDVIDDYEKGKKLSLPDAVEILKKIASTLSYAHQKNIVHRDLKPDNILITADGQLKLTDFGISRSLDSNMALTATGQMLGTPYYMSPEQFKSSKVDRRADIYALGIMAYELATGKRPFDFEEYHTLYVSHLTTPIPEFAGKESGIPVWYQDFVESCCEKEPEKRFQNAKDCVNFLSAHSTGLGAIDRMPYFARRLVKLSSNLVSKYSIALLLAFINLCLFIPLMTDRSLTIGDSLDMLLLDRAFRIRGPVTPPDNIAIIAVDEESYNAKGVSVLRPWPRSMYAELLEKLKAAAPEKIIIDYRFSKIDDALIADPESDRRFADSMRGLPVYISRFMEFKDGKFIWLENDPLFEESAAGLYFANLIDPGVVRHFNTTTGTKNKIPPIASVLYGEGAKEQALPTGDSLINYYGPARTIRPISFHEALNIGESLPLDFFKGKTVFIGQVMALGYKMAQRDTFMTPYGTFTAGVEIHATMAGNILNKNWIERLPLQYEASIILMLSVFISYVFLSLRARTTLYLMLVSIPAWLFVFYVLFQNKFFFPGALLIVPLMPAAYMIAILKSYLEGKKFERILGV